MSPVIAGLDVLEPELLAFFREHQQAVVSTPSSAHARGELGLAYAANGFDAGAAMTFAQAELLEPDVFRWPYYLAQALARLGRLDEALIGFERAANLEDSFAPVWLWRGTWLLEVDEAISAQAAFARAQELADDPATEAAAVAGRARALLRQDAVTEATNLLESLYRDNPHPYVAQLLADAYRRGGKPDAMRRVAQPGTAAQMYWPDPLLQAQQAFVRGFSGRLIVARRLLDEGRAEQALRLLELLSMTRPDDRDLLNNTAIALRLLGKEVESSSVLRNALELHPNFHALHFNMAIHLEKAGDDQAALAHLTRALELDPGLVEAHQHKVNLLMRTNQLPAALAAIDELLRRGPAEAGMLFSAGMLAGAGEQWPLAISRFQQALALNPAHSRAQVFLARAFIEAGRFDEARTALAVAQAGGADANDIAAAHTRLEQEARQP